MPVPRGPHHLPLAASTFLRCCAKNTCLDLLPEVESRTQGSRPRPRTKDTGASVLQKKSLQKFFSDDLQFVGVPRIYWDKPKPQIE